MKKSKMLRQHQGSALIFVVLVLVVVSIMAATITVLFNGNKNQIVYQENSMRAYYVARSGVELAYSALMTDGESLLNTFRTGQINEGQTLQLSGGALAMGEGSVAVSIARCPNPNGTADLWVQIDSTGTLANPAIRSQVRLRFNLDNPEQRIMESL